MAQFWSGSLTENFSIPITVLSSMAATSGYFNFNLY